MTAHERNQMEEMQQHFAQVLRMLHDQEARTKALTVQVDAMFKALMEVEPGHTESLVNWAARVRIMSKGVRMVFAGLIALAAGLVALRLPDFAEWIALKMGWNKP